MSRFVEGTTGCAIPLLGMVENFRREEILFSRKGMDKPANDCSQTFIS
jgi:hypothetical protein